MELTSITSAARAPTGKLSGAPFIAYKLNKKAFRRSERRILPVEFSFCSDAGWRPAEMFSFYSNVLNQCHILAIVLTFSYILMSNRDTSGFARSCKQKTSNVQ